MCAAKKLQLMKIHALLLALVLTLPLLLYGVPYAYASTTSSTYEVYNLGTLTTLNTPTTFTANCNPADYATGGGFSVGEGVIVLDSKPSTQVNPTGWSILVILSPSANGFQSANVFVVCQSPITVAGVGVPEFGSLYIAIALGAMIYFLFARRYRSTKAVSAQPV